MLSMHSTSSSLGLVKVDEGVYYAKEPFSEFSASDFHFLEVKALESIKKRSRICFHSHNDPVHIMLIALNFDSDIDIHMHPNKDEYFQILKGAADVVFFDSKGNKIKSISLGLAEGSIFCKVPSGFYHKVVPLSEFVIFIETTHGPFDSNDTVYIGR